MLSVLTISSGSAASHSLELDLEAVGMQIAHQLTECSKLVQAVLREAPELVICYEVEPADELFKALQIISDTAPCPVIVFTADVDAEKIAHSVEVGVQAYVVNGYAQHRLRPLIHLAQARFKHEQALRTQMLDISSRFEERKMVDRAKGILMRARQVSDDDAFQMLRTASMHSNQRLGQVSQHIIHSAHFAEAVNRAGQLRMLSQRLVKLHLLLSAGVHVDTCTRQLHESSLRIDANLALLGKSLSKPTFGDLVTQVVLTWTRLKNALQGRVPAEQTSNSDFVDRLAEQLLQDAERLTANLESAGSATPLHVLNVGARQRMLSQRVAKYAVLALVQGADDAQVQQRDAGMAEARADFEQALDYLKSLPLSSQDIRMGLDKVAQLWLDMLATADSGVSTGKASAGPASASKLLASLALSSEGLLQACEDLSAQYESSMQMLMGS